MCVNRFCKNPCFSDSSRKTWIPHGKKFDGHVMQVPASNADDHVSIYYKCIRNKASL